MSNNNSCCSSNSNCCDSCIECGACSTNCPTGAIEVKAGVRCAAAVIMGWLTGKEPVCGEDTGECC